MCQQFNDDNGTGIFPFFNLLLKIYVFIGYPNKYTSLPSITIGLSCAQYFTIYVTVCQKAVVLVDDNTTNESGKLCCETAVASTHLCCHQILLFQSPYTGTKRCRQVPFLISFLWTISDIFSNILQFTISPIKFNYLTL